MLREFGVKGVKVQEIFSLDDEVLETLQLVPAVHEEWIHRMDALSDTFFFSSVPPSLANPYTDWYFCSAGGKMIRKSRKPTVRMDSGLPTRLVDEKFQT